jgi:hypothetical protein
MAMTKIVLQALKKSIKKWEAIVNGTGTDKGSNDCALCQIFCCDNVTPDPCAGCPIWRKTRKDFCMGTPYDDWLETSSSPPGRRAKSPEAKKYAEAMLTFLKDLLQQHKDRDNA